MTIRNLDAIFRARSVALIGASTRANSVGLVTAKNLMAAGFRGPIMPINPKHKEIVGLPCYPDVRPVLLEQKCRMHGACMICLAMFGNGYRISTMKKSLQTLNPRDPAKYMC